MLAIDIAQMKTVALVVFLLFWLVVVVRLLLSRSDRYRKDARIPLDDHEPVEPRTKETNGAAHHG